MVLDKPSDQEDEYFAKKEFERRKKIACEKQMAMAAAEQKQLKELHFMHCPKCGMDLAEIELEGIKVDKCTCCRGIWFDDGEVEQLLERESASFLKSIFGLR